MFCSECGRELQIGRTNCCPHCKKEIICVEAENINILQEGTVEKKSKKKKSLVKCILSAIVFVIVVFGAIVWFKNNSAINDDDYINIVKNGSFDMYPDIVIGDAFDNYFSNGKWAYSYMSGEMLLKLSDEGMVHLVEFEGSGEIYGELVELSIWFIVEEETESFYLYDVIIVGKKIGEVNKEEIVFDIILGNMGSTETGNDFAREDNELTYDFNKTKKENNLAEETSVKSSSSNLGGWKEAYLNYLNEIGNIEYGYTLDYIDGDDIPELVIDTKIAAEGVSLCTYNGEKVIATPVGESLKYRLKENLFCVSGGRMDYYYDIVYEIVDGIPVEISRGEYGVLDYENIKYDEAGSMIYQYSWNGEAVSEYDYYTFAEAFNYEVYFLIAYFLHI